MIIFFKSVNPYRWLAEIHGNQNQRSPISNH